MNIRTRLTATFFCIVIVVLSVICLSIYFLSENYREEDFYRRLKNRAINTAKILTEVKEVNADLLKRMERNNPASLPNQHITIYNDSSRELYSSDGLQKIKVDNDLLNRISSEEEIRFDEENLQALGFVWNDSTGRFIIVAAATDIYGLDALRNLRNILIITVCVSIIIVSMLGWFFAGKALEPISRIVNKVSHITEKSLNERLDEGNGMDELSRLSRTFNQMLVRIQNAFESQKTFIANASHEIKTPITAMSAEVEVTLLQKREYAYYVEVLNSVRVRLKDMNKLSTQLLTLAQTSADPPRENFSNFRIDDVLWDVKEEIRVSSPDYTIDIDLSLRVNPDFLVIAGDVQLIKVAIYNLMDNGCKYSFNKTVSILVNSDESKFVTLRFMNTGKGIDADQIDKIFEPFFRGRTSGVVRGAGIGLSLVSRIVNLHRGSIVVNSITNVSTEFIVKIPSIHVP